MCVCVCVCACVCAYICVYVCVCVCVGEDMLHTRHPHLLLDSYQEKSMRKLAHISNITATARHYRVAKTHRIPYL